MSEEKKGFWSKLMGRKKSSGCCSIRIEEEPQDPTEKEPATRRNAQVAADGKQPEPGPCCGGAKAPTRRGGGSCCR